MLFRVDPPFNRVCLRLHLQLDSAFGRCFSLLRAAVLRAVARLFGESSLFFFAIDRIATGFVPGGWITLVVLSLIGLIPLVGILVRRSSLRESRILLTSIQLIVLLISSFSSVFLGSSMAQAIDFEGEWPAEEQAVTLSVASMPVREVLAAAAQESGLGYVGHLSSTLSERPVSLHVTDASLRDVVDAILGSETVSVRRTDSMLIVQPSAETHATEPASIDLAPIRSSQSLSNEELEALSERVAFGHDIVIAAGERVREVVSMGGDSVINGEVIGDVVTLGGDVIMGDEGRVHGQTLTLGGEILIEGEAGGDSQRIGETNDPSEPETLKEFGDKLASSLASHAIIFLAGLFFMAFAPRRLLHMTDTMAARPFKTGLTGFGVLFAVPTLILIMAVTVIGLPAAAALALLGAAAFYTAFAVSGWFVGKNLPVSSLHNRPIFQLALGVCILFVLSWIPVVGFFTDAFALCVGAGAVLRTGFGAHEALGATGV